MKFLMPILIGFSMLLGFLPAAQANCYDYSSTQSVGPRYVAVTLNNATVQKDAPVGTVITEANAGGNADYFGYCDAPAYMYRYMEYGKREFSGVEHVYKTNVPGVGIRLWTPWGYVEAPGASSLQKTSSGYFWTEIVTVSLVVIGPVTPGSVNSGAVGTLHLDGSSGAEYIISLRNSVNIAASSCSISTPNINVKLDDVASADLKSVGKTAKLKNFNIGLDCLKGARVNLKLTGNKNPDTSAGSVLKLTNSGSTGVADGVGIQIVYGGYPWGFDATTPIKISTGGSENFTFGAQYYQTKSTVTAGSANATATFEVTYQ